MDSEWQQGNTITCDCEGDDPAELPLGAHLALVLPSVTQRGGPGKIFGHAEKYLALHYAIRGKCKGYTSGP